MMEQMKEALVIGASEESEYAIKTAQNRGYFVVAVDGNPLAGGFAYANRSEVVDISDSKKLIEDLSDHSISLVLPVPIGRYLTSTGIVNDHFGLKGISEKSAQLCTDKYAFHVLLHQHGLRDGDCLLIKRGEDAQGAITRCNEYLRGCSYESIILKPRYGSGSRNVVIISKDENANAYFANQESVDEDVIAEPAYPGSEYGVDGIVHGGKLNVILLREKIISPAPFRQAVAYIANHVCRTQVERAQEYLQSIVTLLEMDDCVIHCDLMWDGREFKVIELSGRPSGHNLHNLFVPITTGVNVIDCFIDICEGLDVSLDDLEMDSRVYLIGYYDYGSGKLLSVPSAEQLHARFNEEIIACTMNMKPGIVQQTKDGHGLMGRGYFVIAGNTRDDVLKTRKEVLDYVFANFEESF